MRPIPSIHPLQTQLNNFSHDLERGVSAYNTGNLDVYYSVVDSTGKVLDRLCRSDHPDIALSLELPWYQALVKKIESDDHYAACFRHHSNSLWEAGRRFSPGPILTGDSNCIAFVAQNSVLLGHTEVMLLVMQDWKRRYPNLRILFFGLSPCQPDLAKRLAAIGVGAITAARGVGPLELVKWLREALLKENVGTAVWLSLPVWVPFIFGFRVAKRQVFWSLKFHPVHLGDEVIHIGMTKTREGIIDLHGKPWQAYQPPLAVAIRKRDAATRTKFRGDYDGKFLFATLARTEKFNSSRFVSVVASILKECPNSLFLFTGREISPLLEKALIENGVAQQALFVGWVDTEIYANLIDCFLETFPFGCGVTGMQALSHSTPVISHWDEDTLPTFYFKDATDAAKFHSNWQVTTSETEYVEAAIGRYQDWTNGGKRTPMQASEIASLDAEKYERFFTLVTGR